MDYLPGLALSPYVEPTLTIVWDCQRELAIVHATLSHSLEALRACLPDTVVSLYFYVYVYFYFLGLYICLLLDIKFCCAGLYETFSVKKLPMP